MATAIFRIDTSFEERALLWAQQFDELCFFQSNGHPDPYSKLDRFLAVQAIDVFESVDERDIFSDLEAFKAKHPQQWMPGFFSYDLKDQIEDITPKLPAVLHWPKAYFFVPSIIIHFFHDSIEIQAKDPHAVFQEIQYIQQREDMINLPPINIQKRFSKQEYLRAFDHMQRHIQRGDIYEVNLCQEFYAEDVQLDPLLLYRTLNSISPTPFACFFKFRHRYVLSASPERFLAKRGDTLISQPIKGTAPRGKNEDEDAAYIQALIHNPKEIAENVMIVDLVRNDLTRSAIPGSVNADKRLEVHTFKQVHQLISTITCEKSPQVSDTEVLKNTFPAGSMTGAPKVSAMKLCERYEACKRGLYSGGIGYFAPDGDFDFNVVIRSIIYDQSIGYLSFHTGGAITLEADAEREYAECLLKASAILETLKTSV